MTTNPFFVCGMLRSGTTLLQNLLNSIPQLGCSNQQLTEFFINTKRAFLSHKDLSPYHVLSNYFPAITDPQDFTEYLNKRSFQNEYLQSLELNKSGNKEVLAEEFIPFLSQHIKTILIIRNPKDVITSLRFGNASKYTGPKRPLLFDIRNWRKSVAFAINEQSNPNFLLIKYENLVTNFAFETNQILNFLCGEKAPAFDKIEWKIDSNSSFEKKANTINTSPINSFQNHLPESISAAIDYLCAPEMKYLGYPYSANKNTDLSNSTEFRKYNDSVRSEFSGFDLQKELEREETRLDLLRNKPTSKVKTIRDNFIFETVYKQFTSQNSDANSTIT